MNYLNRCSKFFSISIVFISLAGSARYPVSLVWGQESVNWQTKYLAEAEELKQKIERDPNSAKLHYQLADQYLAAEHWAEAASALKRVVQIKPDFAEAHQNLGWCYSYLGKHEEALNAHKRAAEYAHVEVFGFRIRLADALSAVALDYFNLRRYDESIATNSELLRLDPHNDRVLYSIGQAYLAQGNREEASKITARLSSTYGERLRQELSSNGAPANARTANAQTDEDRGAKSASSGQSQSEPMNKSLRPTILYREKAQYTEIAWRRKVQGVTALKVVFFADGRLGDIQVLRGLPYGLTTEAINAAKKIRFSPAIKDGKPVSVRGQLEYSFNLY